MPKMETVMRPGATDKNDPESYTVRAAPAAADKKAKGPGKPPPGGRKAKAAKGK